MKKLLEIYDRKDNRIISGEFRPVRQLDTGAQLGYFESAEYANALFILVLYPDGTYFFAERLQGTATQGSRWQRQGAPSD